MSELRELSYRQRTIDHLSDWLYTLFIYLTRPAWRRVWWLPFFRPRESCEGPLDQDGPLLQYLSGCSQDLAATVDIGQLVVQDLGRRLPRPIAGRRKGGGI